MDIILQQLLSILVAPPGNLIYHLALAFAIFASLQVALISRRASPDGPATGRSLLGLNLLLVAQLALFFSSGLAWQGVISPHYFLPILDRAVILFSLVWIGWMWAFPNASRSADIITGLLNLGIIILVLFTYNQWLLEDSSFPFNGSWQDWTWALSSLLVVVVVIILLLFRRPDNWGIGIGMMALNVAGLLVHLFAKQLFLLPDSGDFSGYLRLAQLASFPLLPSLLVRSSRHGEDREKPVSAGLAETAQPADLQLVHVWLDLSLQTEPAKTVSSVARAVAHTMGADLCIVATAPTVERGPVMLQGGYDMLREEELNGTLLDQAQVPAIASALSRAKPMRILSTETQPPDLNGLGIALGLPDVGNVLLIPLTHNSAPWGGLLLLSAYSKRVWNQDDQNSLAAETDNIVRVLRRTQDERGASSDFEQLRASLAELGLEIDELRQDNLRLANEAQTLRSAVAQTPEQLAGNLTTDLDGLLSLHQETQTVIQSLQAENLRLKAELDRATAASRYDWVQEGSLDQAAVELPLEAAGGDTTQIEAQMRTTLAEVARLQNQLAASNIRVLELERKNHSGSSLTGEDYEVITSIVQELRQPMASVVGYTDLLLSETVGILGSLQRKFLERVRSASERMHGLMDDLIQVTALNTGSLELISQPVDLSVVIDTAIAEVSARLREKNIDLRIEIPAELPTIQADREGLLQILGQLLQNACNVTPEDKSITLKAGLRKEVDSDFLIIQVTDEGGGIAPEDLPNVFNRRYKADNVLIQGVGDTGVGLSIARSMVEAHRGRIWVESANAQSSTYSVLLPIAPSAEKVTPKK